MNWNILLAYFNSFMAAIGTGITFTAFSVFITQTLGLPNLVLGNLFTIAGLASTIFVFPSGYLADKYRRDILIRLSVLFLFMGQILLITSTTLIGSPETALIALIASRFLDGMGWGLSGPAAQALIADSLEAGNRSHVYARMHFVNLGASAIGPFLAIGLTLIFGDTWAIGTLQNLIIIGAIASIFGILSLGLMSDDQAVTSRLEIPSQDKQIEKEPVIATVFGREFSYDVVIPSVIVISGIIIGFGAGATVAFFPVLFADPHIGYGLKPLFTYTIMGITSLVTGFAGIMAQKLIQKTGRIGSMFLVQGLAILCLLGLVINLVLYQGGTILFETSVLILVFFYISRNSLMNASGPISRSIVMDVVPSKDRGKWNSLETLAWGMFWSVSASIGGFVVDTLGFLYVFVFTATLYSIATLVLLTIRKRVPKESVLSRTYQIGRLSTRNRVVMSSNTLNGSLKPADHAGQLKQETISFYANVSQGGVGLICLQPAYISNSGKQTVNQLGIHEDYCIPRLQELVEHVHQDGALIGIRITHAGAATRRSITGSEPLSASSIQIPGYDPPRALESGELLEIRQEFVNAAHRAVVAGFDVIELSSFFDPNQVPDLFTQFLSPKFNKRTDKYGGSFGNRMQFPLEVIKDIKSSLPPSVMLAFYVCVPTHELVLDELIEFVGSLCYSGIEILGLDFVDRLIEQEESIELIKRIRKEFPALALIFSGDFDVRSGENAIKKGQADLIGFETLLQRDASFPNALR
ncbi:MAG: MFS transporter [Candidatus Thorarchaeota archaeon]